MSDQEALRKEIIRLDRAVITRTHFDRRRKRLQGCVYDRTGCVVPASQRILRQMDLQLADPQTIDPSECEQDLQGTAIYLGHYTGQYGHFLLESLARCWVFEQAPAYDWILFSPFVHRTPPFDKFAPARLSFASFGIAPGAMKLIRRTTRVEHLVLPTKIVEFMSPRTVNPEARRIYSTIAAHCRHVFDRARRDLPRKVYLSRSHWRFSGFASNPLTRRGVKLAGKVLGPAGVSLKSLMNRPVVNEQEVEDLFRSHGFTVIHPGALSYEEQVSIYSQADILAGFSGSAMHNTVFMKEGARAIHLESVYNVRAPQRLCDRLSRIRTDVIEFQGEVIDPAIGASRIDMERLRERLQRILSP